MGNYNTRSVRFRQSVADFPVTVDLGEKSPSWGLTRWRGNTGLRFIPPDDERYSLRGDKRQLLYKGHRRSHRFTIHSDTSFEYDCILNREPESNVITLLMDGAEHFDFFRQPDFVPEPFLKGSYAVYKKETLIGEGTGKLCHIHRPEIIDARGRRCWGDLTIVGNELRITIPEQWLAKAAYPVIVDPTVGTTTVGSQTLWDNDPPEPWSPLSFECSIPVNRFTVPDTLNGNCIAFFYTHHDDWEAGGRPVIYSDNFNQPHLRRSQNESLINFRVISSNPAGWRSGSFSTNTSIPSGSLIWFGCFAEYFWLPRFDYGGVFHEEWWDNPVIPNTYPRYTGRQWTSTRFTFRPSMYFTYTSAQNYVRTLTQGVRLTDTKNMTADYKRSSTEQVQANSFLRKIHEINRSLKEVVQGLDKSFSSVLFFRSVQEAVTIKEMFHHLGAFLRGLIDKAGVDCEAKPGRVFLHTLTETVQAADFVFRGLLLSIRIVTQAFVRDYFLSRFLKARQEIELKSCICIELILESKI